MNSEILDLVNENDEVIGKKRRAEIHRNGDLHRVSHVWVFNSNGKILCQKRSANKDLRPNAWDVIVGGHVLSGSSYEGTAVQELYEEYGLKVGKNNLIPLTLVRHELTDNGLTCRKFIKIFGLKFDDAIGKISFDINEVSEIKFFSIGELQKIRRDKTLDFVSFEHFDKITSKIKEILSGSIRI